MTSLEPGPELDAAVATALGWRMVRVSDNDSEVVSGIPPDVPVWESALQLENWRFVPSYSTSPGDAIVALEEFCERHGFLFDVRFREHGMCVFVLTDTRHEFAIAVARSLPHAVCLAILDAHEKLKGVPE